MTKVIYCLAKNFEDYNNSIDFMTSKNKGKMKVFDPKTKDFELNEKITESDIGKYSDTHTHHHLFTWK